MEIEKENKENNWRFTSSWINTILLKDRLSLLGMRPNPRHLLTNLAVQHVRALFSSTGCVSGC